MKHAVVALALLGVAALFAQDRSDRAADGAEMARLAPTAHPALPADPSHYWFVPDTSATRTQAGRAEDPAGRLARAAGLIATGDFAAALPLTNGAGLTDSPLVPYAQYYRGVALAGLGRAAEAKETLSALVANPAAGNLTEVGPLRLAEVLVESGDGERAEDLLEELSEVEDLSAPDDVLLALGRVEEAIGHRDHAVDAYRRLYYEFPLATQANEAYAAIERLDGRASIPPARYGPELARAERLFAARRWAQARAAFGALQGLASGDDRELIALRLAEADYYLDRFRAAREGLRQHLDGRREAEARFFYLTATGAMGDDRTYVTLARQLVADHPESEWAAETLNNLASHYIINDDDAQADLVFREMLRRFPRHRHAERAAWKAGWFSYRQGRFAETVDIFETAAATFPRADNRPAWLYWSGRARDRLGDTGGANARYRLAVTDYANSYYGRLASRLLRDRREPPVAPATKVAATVTPPASVPTADLIRALAAAGLYDEALREVQYAQRVWGDSAQLQATSAWIRHRQGLTLSGTERFTALRGAITTMRRAYPQFLAAGGEQLPADVLRIIFPLDFWPLITKYAKAHNLDPFLLTALMAQESTFTPEIRSAANAYGLMQLIPATGRSVARQLGVRRFSTSMLTDPETNVRLGTKYFKDMVDRFGGVHYALAGYNAGPHRVVAWLKEAPGLPQDEFVDNIPYAETQAYVKRILGTAEDYRRLYGGGVLDPNARLARRAD